MKLYQSLLPLAVLAAQRTNAYNITGAGDISLTDVDTEISGLATIFTGEPILVSVSGLSWDDADMTNTTIMYETFVNGKSAASGEVALNDGSLPTQVDAGTITLEKKDRGTTTIRVEITSGESAASTSAKYQSFRNGTAIIPLLVVLFFAATTRIVSHRKQRFRLLVAVTTYILTKLELQHYRWNSRYFRQFLWVHA